MNYYARTQDKAIGMVYVTQSTSSNYLNQYLIFIRKENETLLVNRKIQETSNYYAKPIQLLQIFTHNRSFVRYHYFMKVNIKNTDGSTTSYLSNSKFNIDSDSLVSMGHIFIPQEFQEDSFSATIDHVYLNLIFKDGSSNIKISEGYSDENSNRPLILADIGNVDMQLIFSQVVFGRPHSANWMNFIQNGTLNFAMFRWNLPASTTCINSPGFTFTSPSQLGHSYRDDNYMAMPRIGNFILNEITDFFTDNNVLSVKVDNSTDSTQTNFEEYDWAPVSPSNELPILNASEIK